MSNNNLRSAKTSWALVAKVHMITTTICDNNDLYITFERADCLLLYRFYKSRKTRRLIETFRKHFIYLSKNRIKPWYSILFSFSSFITHRWCCSSIHKWEITIFRFSTRLCVSKNPSSFVYKRQIVFAIIQRFFWF